MNINGWPVIFTLAVGTAQYVFRRVSKTFHVQDNALPTKTAETIKQSERLRGKISTDGAFKQLI